MLHFLFMPDLPIYSFQKTLKSQDQLLMRQFTSLRTKINTLKDEIPTIMDRTSMISYDSSKADDDEIFYVNGNARVRINSNTSFRSKSLSISDEEKL